MTLPANFTARTLVMPTPCIVWMGALNAKGYGCFGLDGDTKLETRWHYIGPRTNLDDLVLAQLDFDITEDSP